MKNKGNIVSQQENDNSPAIKLKGTLYDNLTDEEFKRTVIKKFKEKMMEQEDPKLTSSQEHT